MPGCSYGASAAAVVPCENNDDGAGVGILTGEALAAGVDGFECYFCDAAAGIFGDEFFGQPSPRLRAYRQV
jgi:hypothetical protein